MNLYGHVTDQLKQSRVKYEEAVRDMPMEDQAFYHQANATDMFTAFYQSRKCVAEGRGGCVLFYCFSTGCLLLCRIVSSVLHFLANISTIVSVIPISLSLFSLLFVHTIAPLCHCYCPPPPPPPPPGQALGMSSHCWPSGSRDCSVAI